MVITPEELEALQPQKTRTIDIEEFVDLEQIDPIYYDHPYYLAPDKGAAKAYKLLLDAMEEAGQGRDRARRDPLEGEPRGDPPARRRDHDGDDAVPRRGRRRRTRSRSCPPTAKAKTTKRELDMAKQLIESLSGDFDASSTATSTATRVLDMIERKAAGRGDHDRGARAGAQGGPGPDGGAGGVDRRREEPRRRRRRPRRRTEPARPPRRRRPRRRSRCRPRVDRRRRGPRALAVQPGQGDVSRRRDSPRAR